VRTYYEQFGVPLAEAKLAKQVDTLLDWIDECLLMPELPDPMAILAQVATHPQLFAELKFNLPGNRNFDLPDRWYDRIERLNNPTLRKHPQTIEHWE